MGPKTLSGMLGWPSHLSGLCTVWAIRAWIVEAILLQIWESPLPQQVLSKQDTVSNTSDLLEVLIQECPHKIIKTGLLGLGNFEQLQFPSVRLSGILDAMIDYLPDEF